MKCDLQYGTNNVLTTEGLGYCDLNKPSLVMYIITFYTSSKHSKKCKNFKVSNGCFNRFRSLFSSMLICFFCLVLFDLDLY